MNSSNDFESFCGGPIWDANLTWNTFHPDFTRCFQDTVLILAQCGFLWLVTPFYFLGMTFTKSRPLARTKLFLSKMVLSILLVVVDLMNMLIGVEEFVDKPQPYLALVISPSIRVCTFVLVCLIIEVERRKGFITSGVLFLFFLLSLLFAAIPLNSVILHAVTNSIIEDPFRFTTCILHFLIVAVELILFCFADPHPRLPSDNPREPCPEIESSFLSRVTYVWTNSLVTLGYKKSLEEPDVWLPNPRDLTRETAPILEKYWTQEKQQCDFSTDDIQGVILSGQPVSPGYQKLGCLSTSEEAIESTPLLNGPDNQAYTDQVIFKKPAKKKSASLFLVMARVFGLDILEAHFCKLIADFLVFVGPLLQSLMIEYTSDPNIQQWKGYLYAVLFFVNAILNSCLFQQTFQINNAVSLRIKASLINIIYKKALTMSNEARKTTTVGEIVNLMSVDAERIQEVIPYLWVPWSAPLQISIAVALLYNVVGASVFAGLGTMVIMFPINAVLASFITKCEMKVMTLKDQRIKLMNEVLNGMKVLKLQAWELSFMEKVRHIRNQELKYIKQVAYLVGVETFTWSCAPFLVTLATFATYVMTGGVLDANKAFTALSLLNILRMPIFILPLTVSMITMAYVSLKRIGKYLQTTDLDNDNVSHDTNTADRIVIENGTFAWGTTEDDLHILKNINISVTDGSLTAIVGPVGVGKSSMILAILGEMEKIQGRVNVRGSIAYVAQQAWIQNMTLRDNILFGEPFDEVRYNAVLDACALRPDLNILPAGDLTEIGEKGINLSGGQKQRVSLARAVYQDRDIYLLDDPLSAVDSLVGRHLFEEVIGDQGLLRKKTRILVTHGIHYLPKVENIIVLLDGKVSEIGAYDDLLSHDGPFALFIRTYMMTDNGNPEEILIDNLPMSGEQSVTSDDERKVRLRRRLSSKSSVTMPVEHEENKLEEVFLPPDKLIQEEVMEEGRVKWSVFLSYIRAIGSFMVVTLMIAYILFEVSSMLSSVWLSIWTEDPVLQNSSLVNTSIYLYKRDLYLSVYGGLGAFQTCFILMHSLLSAYGCVRASTNLHDGMLKQILRCPLAFFDTVPIGRILNRFSRDIETIDSTLPETVESWLMTFFEVLATLIILCYSTPIFISVLVPVLIVYFFIQRFYIPTSRQLKRITSRTRSPIYVHFSETVSGTSTIRAYRVMQRFIEESEGKVDHNIGFNYAAMSSNRWLGFRVDFLGALIVMAAALFAVIGRGTISGGIVGLSISYALQITGSLNWWVRMTTDLETNMVAVERVEEYSNVPSEAEWQIEKSAPKPSWPDNGAVAFQHYSTRYRPGLDLVLRDISVTIRPTEKIGIVGRTGAGKSSLTLALFRLVEPAEGDIVIDGAHISTMGLHQLRSRLTILPQDPVLFSGTLRMNLDPFDRYTDGEIWQALANAHLKNFVESLPAGIYYECGESGNNLSVGQRQLVCLARTLIRKTKILVLDEATAAVDLETDELIQNTIREEFSDSTVITIAHRLNTIMDCDRVLVLDQGEIKEFDSPINLLQQRDSIFYAMAKDAGIAS